MDVLLLIAYVVLVGVTWWRSRSLAFAVVAVVASVSVFGALINFSLELGYLWSRTSLQMLLLIALVAAAAAAFIWKRSGPTPMARGVLSVVVPALVLIAFLVVVTWVLTEEPAFMRPVSYLIGHGTAEDNAKWLDFTAKFASGDAISQFVPLGGPLQLVLTFIGTLMGVISMVMLGGYNEVAVAANTVVLGSYLLAALTPLALAPLAEGVRARRSVAAGSSEGTPVVVPWPLMWLGSAALVSASLVVTGYGHLTFQYTLIVMVLWSSVFLTGRWGARGLLVVSLAAAAMVTVWLPLNALAAVILVGWLIAFVVRLARRAPGAVDPVSWVLWLVVGVALWVPIWSSLSYVAGTVSVAASSPLGGAVRGVVALVVLTDDTSLFSSPGGTEQAGPLLVILAVASLVGAAWVVCSLRARRSIIALVPLLLLVAVAILIALVDFWVTGAGPHYGSLKFMFLAAVVVAGVCLPVALLVLDWPAAGMTAVRWLGLLAVIALLTVDTLLPRALAATRPAQWSPPIPFENTSGSYWYPADVNQKPVQSIADNPVACVYLPPGAAVPTAILDSQLSDAQRVYNCSRILAGLSGMDHDALPVVDWLRREWLTNSRAWAEMYPRFEELSDAVKAKKVILLDDGSNVVGLETFGSLMERFPKFAGKTPEELAQMGVDPNAQ